MSEQGFARELEYFGLEQAQRDTLREMAPALTQALDPALSHFYATVSRAPEVTELFRDDQHRAHAKSKQVEHWAEILSGNYAPRYFEAVSRIGKVHSDIGLEPKSYMGGYAAIATDLIIAAMRSGIDQPAIGKARLDRAERYIDALVRAVFFDMQGALDVYLREGERKAAEQRGAIADAFDRDIGEVIVALESATHEMDEASRSVDAAVEAALEGAGSAQSGAEEASANVRSVAAASEQMQASAKEIAGQVSATTATAADAVDQVSEADRTMRKLNEVTDQIGSVVGLIQEIAEQTNLLALNATIESARAGEAGKGFAVVASEVKTLAGQTARATDDIASQIREVQTAAATVAGAFASIQQTIDRVNEASVNINAAVEEQSVVISEITRNTTQAAMGNEESVRSTTSLQSSVQKAGDASSQVRVSAEDLRKQMPVLTERAAEFLARVRQA